MDSVKLTFERRIWNCERISCQLDTKVQMGDWVCPIYICLNFPLTAISLQQQRENFPE